MASGARGDAPHAARDAGGATRKKGKRPAAETTGGGRSGGWWGLLEGEDMISLETLSSLPYPPFKLPSSLAAVSGGAGGGHRGGGGGGGGGVDAGLAPHPYNFFDGKFTHPVSRRAVAREECAALDAYMLDE
ncbi:hypothetical protein T484DRAFT_1796178 [Baffinella frigidus]|nr:hypothetical protein T484DRAFT_1796178 [Cryptophyta sp. CCMP2293]